ncbi:MAG: hypothetical protein IPN76_21710 [Saprospiraceae bacterium]|nr:hypothetical protein [Saprospiraceae bacterium]
MSELHCLCTYYRPVLMEATEGQHFFIKKRGTCRSVGSEERAENWFLPTYQRHFAATFTLHF